MEYRSPNTKDLYLVVKLVGDNEWHAVTGSYDGWMLSVDGVRFMFCEDKKKKNDPCFTSSFTVENPY